MKMRVKKMKLKISLMVLFLILTLFVYGCAKTSDISDNEQNIDVNQQTQQVTDDITDFDQLDQDMNGIDDIDLNELDF